VYRADSEMAPPGGPVVTTMGLKVVSLNMAPGSSRYDTVMSLDPVGISEHNAFNTKMAQLTSEFLDELEHFCTDVEAGFALANDLPKLQSDFNKLLQIMNSLYKVRVSKADIDQKIDNLVETLIILGKAKQKDVPAKEKRLEAIHKRWTEIKKNAPQIKSDVQPI